MNPITKGARQTWSGQGSDLHWYSPLASLKASLALIKSLWGWRPLLILKTLRKCFKRSEPVTKWPGVFMTPWKQDKKSFIALKTEMKNTLTRSSVGRQLARQETRVYWITNRTGRQRLNLRTTFKFYIEWAKDLPSLCLKPWVARMFVSGSSDLRASWWFSQVLRLIWPAGQTLHNRRGHSW